MGCDIHGWVEKKVGEKWVGIKELRDDSRNYKRFAKLAGVRGDGPSPSGLPNDISDTAQFWADNWGTDGHSHGHLPLIEAFEVFKSTSGNLGLVPDENYSPWAAFEVGDDELDEMRLVFWFDN